MGRLEVLRALAQGWPDDDTRTWLTNRATTDNHEDVRQAAIQALADGWRDDRSPRLDDLAGAPFRRS